jgi:hypothetical protein
VPTAHLLTFSATLQPPYGVLPDGCAGILLCSGLWAVLISLFG